MPDCREPLKLSCKCRRRSTAPTGISYLILPDDGSLAYPFSRARSSRGVVSVSAKNLFASAFTIAAAAETSCRTRSNTSSRSPPSNSLLFRQSFATELCAAGTVAWLGNSHNFDLCNARNGYSGVGWFPRGAPTWVVERNSSVITQLPLGDFAWQLADRRHPRRLPATRRHHAMRTLGHGDHGLVVAHRHWPASDLGLCPLDHQQRGEPAGQRGRSSSPGAHGSPRRDHAQQLRAVSWSGVQIRQPRTARARVMG